MDAEGTQRQNDDMVCEWWGALADVLQATVELRSDPGTADGPQFVPVVSLSVLRKMARELSYGSTPEPIKDARKCGNIPTYGERKARAVAVAYKLAVRDGRIKDRCSTQTVAQAYGLGDGRSVTRWMEDEKLRSEFPVIFGWSTEMLRKQLIVEGEGYKIYGPTTGAIAARGTQTPKA